MAIMAMADAAVPLVSLTQPPSAGNIAEPTKYQT
jgi:hypothetical protein